MSIALKYEIGYEPLDCCKCGFYWCAPCDWVTRRRKDRKSFYCPSCSTSQSFRGKTEEQKLRERLEREEKRRKWAERKAEQQKRQASAYKGQNTKLKKRISKGVCPCCNRSFVNLARHMKNQHPDW